MGDGFDVKLVNLADANGVTGQYGFCISDESQKINLIDKYSQSSGCEARKVRCCCPHTFEIDAISWGNARVKKDFILAKFDFPEQFSSIRRSVQNISSRNKRNLILHFHGILSDATRRGLRQDLSQMANHEVSSGRYGQYLFVTPTEFSTYITISNVLLLFCDLPSRFRNNGMAAFAAESMFRPQMFDNYEGAIINSPRKDLQPATTHGIHPVVTQSNVSIGVAAVNGDFAFIFVPQVVL
jgi:hypothetical protein